MVAEKSASSKVKIRMSKWVKQTTKTNKRPQSKNANKNLCMYINAITKKHNKQTTNKPLTARRPAPTTLPTTQEKQKTQTSPNKNKNEIKTHRKKAGTTSNHTHKCKRKKTQRIIGKQGAGGKNNTPGNLVAKTRKNDRNINFVEKK